MLLAARPGVWNFIRAALVLIALMQIWNLIRVVTLFNLRSGSQIIYDVAHVYVSPYLTVLLGLAAVALPVLRGLQATAEQPTKTV